MHHTPAHAPACLCLACVQRQIAALFAAADGRPLSPVQRQEYRRLLRADYAARQREGGREPEDEPAAA